jgi:hypothetical protein
MATMAILPIGIALILAVLALLKSKEDQKKNGEIVVNFYSCRFSIFLGKVVFIQDEVAEDAQFEETADYQFFILFF